MIRPIHILKLASVTLVALLSVHPAVAQQADHFRYLDSGVAAEAGSAQLNTAAAVPGPIQATTAPGASGVVSDDFSAPSLESIWTFENPLGDASVAVNGTQAVLTVPATGSIHDVWTSENTLPRIMQDVSDSDFEVVAKFESTLPSGTFASQGILVEQSDLDVIRVEFHRYGSQTRIFVVSLFGGGYSIKLNTSITLATPMYLRVGRAGNVWTIAHSTDGSTFTTATSFSQAMSVSRVGVFAGNAADTPVTALVDYFFESTAPIVPEDGPGDITPPVISNVQVAPTAYGAVVTWDTDEPASTRLDFGLDSGYGSFEESATLVTSHQVTLTGLTPATEYHFSASSADFYANAASTTDDVFNTLADVTAPIISNVVVTPSTSGATVTWNTDEPATSRVDFGADSGYGFFEADGTLKTSHSLELTSLAPSTTYHFSVTSDDAYANSASSLDDTFTTEDVDTTPPVISNLVVTPTTDGAVITWDTDEPATSRVDYGNDAGYGSFEEDLALVTSHQLTITGLAMGVEQHFMVTTADADANAASTSDGTFTTQSDSTPPVISNVQVVPTTVGAMITWDTDEPATSRVDYGADAGYGLMEQSGSFVTSHSIAVSGLAPGTTYHFAVTSEDASTNSASTSDATFATSALPTTDAFDFGLIAVEALYPGNGKPGWSSSGDINQDGLIDIVAGGGQAVQWYEAPSWTRHSIELGSTVGGNGGLTADVDRDGDLDVVTSLFESDLVWFENPGPATVTGPWTRHTIDGSSPLGFAHDLIATDLDNDGEDEYVALYVVNGGVAWYDVPANPAVDPWPKTTILAATNDPFVGLAAGDLDGDGDNDVVISNSWYENDGPSTPNWTARTIFADDVQNVIVYDVDQDGRNDVVGAQGFSSPGMVMWGQGPVLKSDPWVVNIVDANLDGPENIWAGDLDSDGFTDILSGEMESSDGFGDAGSNLIAYSSTDVAGLNWTKEFLATNVGVSARINPVDFDADGDLDFVADGNGESHIYLWENGPEGSSGSGAVSDDFSAPALNTGLWTFVDPLADGSSVSVTGTQAVIDVPATGVAHEVWAGVNTVPRLMQPVADGDFEVEAKFESALGSGGGFQSQGIMIEQDPSNFLRIEYYRSGGKRRVFVATIAGGSANIKASLNTSISAPMYLRVGRVGDQWTVLHSLDGTNFNVAASFGFPLAVTQVGVYAGNDAGTAHTAIIDYFFDTSSPIVPEDGGGGADITAPVVSNIQVTPDVTGATITWDTNEPATSRVDYGLTAGYGSFEEDLAFVTSHSVVLSGLTPGTEYHYEITTSDVSDNTAQTGDATFSTTVDVTGPVVSNVQVVTTPSGATVTWDTDEPATSRVDYGLDAGYGSFEESVALVTSHSVELTSLTSDTEYHFQVTSTDAYANGTSTSDATFTTDPIDLTDPVISNVQVVPSATGATVTWDTDEPATSRVDFGADAGYGSFEEDATLVMSHSVELTGLSPETEYHYQITSADASSNTSSTTDATFTTPAAPGLVVSDDFSAPALNTGLWTFVDPLDDGASISVTGTQAVIDVPATGVAHEAWTGVNTVPRLVQTVDDTDFEVEAKFESTLGSGGGFQSQGIMIEQDPSNFLRIEYYRSGGKRRVFVASIGGGSANIQASVNTSISAPMYLRVGRVGDQWTVSHSLDGTNFNVAASFGFPLAVTQVGVYAGNDAGTAHTAIIDYFFETSSPIVPEDGGGGADITAPVVSNIQVTPDVTGATITWDTNEPATSRVDYGLDAGYGSFEEDLAFVTSHSVVLTGLTPGTEYHYEITTSDVSDNTAQTGDATFSTTVDVTGPVVSNVQVVTTPTGATVTWDTDEPATSRVDYGLNAGYGSFEESLALVTSHSVELTSLTSDTEYHFQVTSTDVYANGTSTSDATFTTDPIDLTDPVISNVQVVPSATGATVTWDTDEPATSRVDYGADAGYGLFEEDATLVMSHSVELTGLSPETEYHYQVTSADASSNTASTTDATFTTPAAPGLAVSDDFSAPALNTGLWTFIDPLGDAAFGLTGTQAMIEVPANGAIHSVWTDSNTLPRLMQTVDDTDFEVEAKFESDLGAGNGFQSQGILVEQDPLNVIRVEFYRSGTKWRLFVASIFGGSADTELSANIGLPAPMYMRVGRVGDQWTVWYSFDGSSFTQAVSFNQPMTVNAVGIYGGNDELNAHTMIADYFFETSSPVTPEDGGSGSDATPPVVSNVQVDVTSSTATISWLTDEPGTSRVDYGSDAGYGSFEDDPMLTMIHHNIELTNLTPGMEYHYQISSTDGTGNVGTTVDATFTTTPSLDNPLVDIWYGDTQEFGLLGRHQEWVNVLGRVTDLDGMGTLTYTLNGGSSMPLTIGPDDRRLVDAGDFNVEIDYDDLVPGANQIQITAIDLVGNVTVKDVTVNYTSGNVWPLPYSVDWSVVADVQDPGKVVDGEWSVGGGELSTVQLGYDRLYGAGDLTWDDYEVTVPITVNAIDSIGFSLPISGNGAHLGIILRWPGHTDRGNAQPRYYWLPNGGVGGYTWNTNSADDKFSLSANGTIVDEDLTGRTLPIGVPHIIRMRVETLTGGEPYYSFKIWPAADSEPAGWDLEGAGQVGDPSSGGFLIIAHHLDISVGNMDFAPVSGMSSKVAGDYTVARGDVTGDGAVGESDAVALLEEIVSAPSWTASRLLTTDVSGNGEVTAYDAALIRGYDPTRKACPLGNCESVSTDVLVRDARDSTAAARTGGAATSRWSGVSPFVRAGGSDVAGVLGWREAVVTDHTIRIPLAVNDLDGSVTAAQVVLPVDMRNTRLTAVESLLPDDWNVAYHQHDERVVVAMAGTTPLRAGVLLNLELTQDTPTPMLTFAGTGFLNEGRAVELDGVVAGIVPGEFALMPNYPNPFSGSTRISYTLPGPEVVTISVFNMLGQHVATLVDVDQQAGVHEVNWDGRDRTGQRVASGVYLYRLEAGEHVEQRTMIILR